MSTKTIEITIGNRSQMAKEFINAWHSVETKTCKKNAVEKIYCENEKAFFKLLTPKRLELLRFVHEYGDTSILSLAKKLNRDYSYVYQDLKDLSQVGLLIKNLKTSKYKAPWDKLITQNTTN